ncbi:hypothetical protein H9P43_007206 [Blastocladiella emersonii ATCC 22665]|nr:hypothetical protein H9P43_007206 [Blastocladiella emersonii ATCC 22665]
MYTAALARRVRPTPAFASAARASPRWIHLHGANEHGPAKLASLHRHIAVTLTRASDVRAPVAAAASAIAKRPDAPAHPTVPTLALSLPDPTSSPRATTAAFVQHVSPMQTTALDVLNNLRAEYVATPEAAVADGAGRSPPRVYITRGYTDAVLDDATLDGMSLAQLVRANAVVWVHGVPHTFDAADLVADLRTVRDALAEHDQRIPVARAALDAVHKRAETRLRWILYGGAGFLVSELGAIVFLTYELGWDLMEPTSYLLGLGTMIMGSAFYAVLRREYTYENAAAELHARLRERAARKLGVELDALAILTRANDLAHRRWDPLLAAYMPSGNAGRRFTAERVALLEDQQHQRVAASSA